MGPEKNELKRQQDTNPSPEPIKAIKENLRLKLKLSKKDWKRLKRFHLEYTLEVEKRVVDYYSKILVNGYELGDEASTNLFEKHEAYWRIWARRKVTKLGLHSKEGRQEILEQFTVLVGKLMKDEGTTKPIKETKLVPNFEHTEGIINIFNTYDNSNSLDLSILSTCKGDNDIIDTLKDFIPRGGKGKFVKEAKQWLKDSAKK